MSKSNDTVNSKGIKEITELVEGIEAVAVPVAKALADGTVNTADLAHLLDLVKSHQKLIEAVKGLDEIIPEAKDIDTLEAVALVQKLYATANKIKAATK